MSSSTPPNDFGSKLNISLESLIIESPTMMQLQQEPPGLRQPHSPVLLKHLSSDSLSPTSIPPSLASLSTLAEASASMDRNPSPLSIDTKGPGISANTLSVDALLSSSNSAGSCSRVGERKLSPLYSIIPPQTQHGVSPQEGIRLDPFSPKMSVRYSLKPEAPMFTPFRGDASYAPPAPRPSHGSSMYGGYYPQESIPFNAYASQPIRHSRSSFASGGLGGSLDLSAPLYHDHLLGRPQSYHSMPTFPQGQVQSARAAPQRRNPEPIDGFIYQVQFKRAHRNFILAPTAPRNIMPGDFVKVEADRGEDMGIVLSKTPIENFQEVMPTAGYRGRGFTSGQGERKYLFRLATPEEKASLVSKVYDEEVALQIIREKNSERCLPMVVLDAEYQYDRHKLTFYFEAERRIDFRELVSELFSQYKTRIWMQQVDTSALDPNDPGTELAKAAGLLPEREEYMSGQSSLSSSCGRDDRSRSFSAWTDGDGYSNTRSIDVHANYPYRSGFESDVWDPNYCGSSLESSSSHWPNERY